MASGILIDVDHIFDYYIDNGLTSRIRQIYRCYIDRKFRIIILAFHSLELLLLLWLAISYFRMGIAWVAFAIGMTQHILLDMVFNPTRTYAFFFSYRLINEFKKEAIERPVTL